VSGFDDRYQDLRRRFVLRCRDDLRQLQTETDPQKLRPVVHRLSGAAGTFGYGEISADAGEVDDALIEGLAPPADVLARLIATLEALTEDAGDAAG
jgi:HPt (histidine-containing phosphotransfer) domain-containing protein